MKASPAPDTEVPEITILCEINLYNVVLHSLLLFLITHSYFNFCFLLTKTAILLDISDFE